MKGISTEEIMQIGLKLASWEKIPPDSAIHINGTDIKKIFVSVDINQSDIYLAKTLKCDCVLTHHPIGISLLQFHQVFDRHVKYMVDSGIKRKNAILLVKKLKEKVELRSHSAIYDDIVSTSKLLKIPLLNIHQPLDEYMRQVILRKIEISKLVSVSDLVNAIGAIPEFKNSLTRITVCNGKPTNNLGKWVLVVAAGSNGGFDIAKSYFENGISTVIYLHIDYNELIKLRQANGNWNLVVLGHLAGDSIGMNAICNALEKLGLSVIKRGIIDS